MHPKDLGRFLVISERPLALAMMCKYGGCCEEMKKPLRKICQESSTNVVKSADMAVPDKPNLENINRKTAASSMSARKTPASLSAPFNTAPSKTSENGRLKLSSEVEIKASNSRDSAKTLLIIKSGRDQNSHVCQCHSNASLFIIIFIISSPPMSSPHSTSTLFPNKDAEVIQHCLPVKGRSNQTSRKCQGIVSKNSPPNPLRNQRAVLPQPVKNRPWRLSSRSARILEAKNGKKPAGGRDDPGLIPCLKVKLKHQKVHRKEGRQRLFNNVIEETANELILSQKSKVKAPAGAFGAFDAVISLQDDNTCLHDVS